MSRALLPGKINEQKAIKMTLYTIGHSNISIDSFIKLLISAGIEVLVDVRSFPYSRYATQFNKESLVDAVKSKHIEYIFMGDVLGGRPDDSSCYINGKVDYELIRQKEYYQKGLKRLIKGIGQYCVAIMCSEEDPMECHRRNLIARDMYKRGVRIFHIRSSGAIEHDEFSIEKNDILQGTLF